MKQKNHRVVIHADAEIGIIKPELHGHFLEHLGSATYGGIWVGKDSPIQNINGFRKEAIGYLREMGVSVLRWPGGCFADDYHWRDGIGPPQQRPRRVNLWWGNYTEDNSFGTHEFMELCDLLGARPYLAGNLASGTPQELRDWVEYCNQPAGSTLSAERSANGTDKPFGVRYWGVGNESWGCGGHMTPEEYASQYVRYATYLKSFGDVKPYLIAVGPDSNNKEWTTRFFQHLFDRQYPLIPNGFAMHFYSWGKSLSTEYTAETMSEQLNSFEEMEKAIQEQRSLIDKYTSHREQRERVDLLIDEWGTWDVSDPGKEQQYGKLWQQSTIKDGIAAALGLNVFHRNADCLSMCNLAQLTNVLQAPLLAHGNKCIRTPTYYAMKMCGAHKGNTAIRAELDTETENNCSVSVSRDENFLALTIVNPTPDTTLHMECVAPLVDIGHVDAQVLHHDDLNACNTFEAPDIVVPRQHEVRMVPSGFSTVVPPLSVVAVWSRIRTKV
jgi:alpha-L-arabinofuranosidase